VEPKLGFLRWYLLSVLIVGLLGLVDAVLTFLKRNPPLYVKVVTSLLFLFFFFNIFSIAIFRRQRLERMVYVLPLYNIISYILFLSLGVLLTILGTIPAGASFVFIGLQMASALFEAGFSIYLLRRFDFSPPN